MADQVADEYVEKLTGQLDEIRRQLLLRSGYPYDIDKLSRHLQAAIEGRFARSIGGAIWRPLVRDPEASAKHYRYRLSRARIEVSPEMHALLDAIDYDRGPSEIVVALATAHDFGWPKFSTYPFFGEICNCAASYGFKRLPQWALPQFAVDHYDWIKGTVYFAATPLQTASGRIGLANLWVVGDRFENRSIKAVQIHGTGNIQLSPNHTFVFSKAA